MRLVHLLINLFISVILFGRATDNTVCPHAVNTKATCNATMESVCYGHV